MNIGQDGDSQKILLSLQQASEKLGVTIATLLEWNEHNILKPTITQIGEIGYTQEQIDQFLIIRKLSQTGQITSVKTEAVSSSSEQIEKTSNLLPPQNSMPIENNITPDKPNYLPLESAPVVNESGKNGFKFTTPMLFLSFAGIIAVMISVLYIAQGNLNTLSNQQGNGSVKVSDNNGNTPTAQTSSYGYSGQSTPSHPIELADELSIAKNIYNVGESILREKIVQPTPFYGKTASSTASTTNQKKQIATLASSSRQTTDNNIKPNINTTNDSSTMSDASNFASENQCPNCTNQSDSAFDGNGNIKGDVTKTDTLASILGEFGGVGSIDSSRQTTDPKSQLIILTICILTGIFLFNKQLAYAFKPQQAPQIEANFSLVENMSQKVFELDQKTDGTVVLYFQGQEHKISKPELYSDSDQFIGRLMELVQPDIKEMDYNSFNDQKIKFSAPLSRLVTRLGFVGVKRDLFFPRTSKDRVFFRRYITQQDLNDMNLTSSKVLTDLTLPS